MSGTTQSSRPVALQVLTPDECARVLGERLELRRSEVVTSDKWWRRSVQAWLFRPQWSWLYEVLESRIPRDGIDPTLRLNELQLVHYQPAGWYLNHRDNDSAAIAHRRHTISIPLKNAWLGGGLTLLCEGHAIRASDEIGTATIFPASLIHRANPVIAGLRISLVGWLSHPAELPRELAILQGQHADTL